MARSSDIAPATACEAAVPRVRVWDLPTRVFHWMLVVLVTVAAVSKLLEPEWWLPAHLWAGYGVATLMIFRLVWAAFGSHYSHIASFAYRPREVMDYLRGVLMLRPAHHIGHNPAGAVMIWALALVLIGLVVTGLMTMSGEEKLGPFTGLVSYAASEQAKALHSILFNVLLTMIVIHVVGVIVESLLHHENLTGSMLTGWKALPPGTPVPRPRAARPWAAAAAMAAITGTAAAVLIALPGFGSAPMRPFAWDASYRDECGACHWAYHPSLLPATSWRRLVATLPDHFGEDASLDPATAAHISDWLAANAAETWDTEAANRFLKVDPAAPRRITATPYWRRKHASIAPDVFRRNGVVSRSNCGACHRDADSGRFDDNAIHIPKE